MEEDMHEGIKKMALGKEKDIKGMKHKYLRWGKDSLNWHIKIILNRLVKEGFLSNWGINLISPVFKRGGKDDLGKYKTIIMKKVFV